MAFNIFTHIIDHADYTYGELNNKNTKLTHFNTSVDATYFLRHGIISQTEIDQIMKRILTNVMQSTIKVKEKNGVYIKKMERKNKSIVIEQ